jgi:hypothetical protein
MTPLIGLQVAALPDTVVSVPARDIVDFMVALAAGGIAVTFLTILVMLIAVLVLARRGARAAETLRQRFAADPGIQSLRQIAANAEAVSRTARDEVTRLSSAVSHLTERLDQASDLLEERIDDFNALLEVVQGEAEDAFIEGASTARGLRAGLGELGSGRRSPRRVRREGDGDRPFHGHPVDAHAPDQGIWEDDPAGEGNER